MLPLNLRTQECLAEYQGRLS